MATRNVHRDGLPARGQFWCQCARDPHGRFGVAVGCGSLQVGFVPEADVERFLAVLDASSDPHAGAFRAAAAGLPAFTSRMRQITAQLN